MQSKALWPAISERLKQSFEQYGREEATTLTLGLLAACYERPMDPAVFPLYLAALQDLTDEQVITALSRTAREEARFFPPPARLRELAGAETSLQRSEREAKDELNWLLFWIRQFSVEGRPKRGRCIREAGWTSDDTTAPMGKFVRVPEWQPAEYEWTQPTPIPDRTKAALCELGGGEAYEGMKLLGAHPLLTSDKDEYPSLGLRLSAMEKLEARWIEAWRRTDA